MTIRVGLIGVSDTLKIMQETAGEFQEVTCLPLCHERLEEIPDQLNIHDDAVDVWLFSGRLTYRMLEKSGVKTPAFYVPYTGSSVYRILYTIAQETACHPERLSFDFLERQALAHVFREIEAPAKNIHLCPESDQVQRIADFHESLWKTRQTEAAVTCAWEVHWELQRRNVPTYRVVPTRSAVRSVLNTALRTVEMLRFKEMQIAVQLVQLDMTEELHAAMTVSDDIAQHELKVTEHLLNYARHLHGSLKPAGLSRFVIFTTRGVLQKKTGNFRHLPDTPETEAIKGIATASGIGVGSSALHAEALAGKALAYAKQYGNGSWFTALENEAVVGPLGSIDTEWHALGAEQARQISQQTHMDVATVMKVGLALRQRGNDVFTAQELAHYMRIVPRSARRILSALEKGGYAVVIASESPRQRGRPPKRYKITLGSQP
ncbi:helix-turn-helix domain-containing protein [Numidum massiliense]|uniref:hypothetical protein n=1 Tax=Numidum massiliense TaxID=1522315 RepID=UPI0006D59B0C|nr:hypothetical protein [Numidum massiliense]